MTWDDEGRVVPDLAERFEVSENGRTYTFTLRDGVRFHDGAAVRRPRRGADVRADAAAEHAEPRRELLRGARGLRGVPRRKGGAPRGRARGRRAYGRRGAARAGRDVPGAAHAELRGARVPQHGRRGRHASAGRAVRRGAVPPRVVRSGSGRAARSARGLPPAGAALPRCSRVDDRHAAADAALPVRGGLAGRAG